jgi:hypothetical protein
MFGANKKNFGVEFCERGHKLLGPSQVESLKKKKNPCEFSVFFKFFVFNGEAPRIFSLKLINIINKQNNSTHLVLRFHRHTD